MADTERPIVLFWFRRDLRLVDNRAFSVAVEQGLPILPLFIFDPAITATLPEDDARISFIYDSLLVLQRELSAAGGSLLVEQGVPEEVIMRLLKRYRVTALFANEDFEPAAVQRDAAVERLLKDRDIAFIRLTDHVIFRPDAVVKRDGNPYTVFTPYRNRWRMHLDEVGLETFRIPDHLSLLKGHSPIPPLERFGFRSAAIAPEPLNIAAIAGYGDARDYPALDSTSRAGPHLRFGTVSIRRLVEIAVSQQPEFLNELIWREFFIQIMYHYPRSLTKNFRSKYDAVAWRSDEADFERWCSGQTGFPMVDAGMRELNATGYMHNRVRMITAGFFCKDLLLDWRLGERYFAQKLLDYEASSNVGNWQWAAGTGCDAAPYFRVFNPLTQQKRFDPQGRYIRKWVPEIGTGSYPQPMVDHSWARRRAIDVYASAVKR